ALLQGLLGSGARAVGSPLIDQAELDPKLPVRLREFVSGASEEAARGNTAKALVLLARAQNQFPRSPWPVLLQALMHEQEGRAAEAERCEAAAVTLDAAIARDDSLAQYFHTRGLVHLRDERFPAARRSFELAHRLLPHATPPLDM